jgi:ATP-dependent Zn protease
VDILRKNKNILEKGAQLLLEKEKIDGAELKALMESS